MDNQQSKSNQVGAPFRGPRAHSVAWEHTYEFIDGKVTCHAAEGADCRLVCSENCESWIVGDHPHELIDHGCCLFVEWMEAEDGVALAYCGASHPVVNGFIEIEYHDDHYTWSYADAG